MTTPLSSAPMADSHERRRQVIWLPLLVAAAFFMENLDATVITTVMPRMADSFGVRAERLSVGISAYLLALAVFIPVSGWVADRYGARRVFSGAILLFTVSSVLCALSQTLGQFTAARILQGLGGALMVPIGRLVVLRNVPKERLVSAIATITWPGLAAPVIGPLVGGYVATVLSWHWIFLLNVPLGIISVIAAQRLMKDTEEAAKAFDLAGFLGMGAGCALLMYGLDLLAQPALIRYGAALSCGGILVLAAITWHLLRTASPLVDLRVLGIRTFRVTVAGGSLFRIAIGSAPFLLPLMFQLSFGMSPVAAGSLLLWLFAGNLSMKPATSWVMRTWGFKRVLVVNGVLVALGFLACALFTADTPIWCMCAVLFFCGLTRSMQFTVYATLGFADVPSRQMASANTLASMAQQINAGMGIAIGALALAIAHAFHAGEGSETALAATDFRWALVAMGCIALIGTLDNLKLSRTAGDHVSGHHSVGD